MRYRFGAFRVKDHRRWYPGRVEAVEPRRMFLDVSRDREEIRMNEGADTIVRARLGFQRAQAPHAGAALKSSRIGRPISCACFSVASTSLLH